MPVELSLASEGPTEEEQDFEFGPSPKPHQLVSPGDVITRDTGYMRGHGTYMKQAGSRWGQLIFKFFKFQSDLKFVIMCVHNN